MLVCFLTPQDGFLKFFAVKGATDVDDAGKLIYAGLLRVSNVLKYIYSCKYTMWYHDSDCSIRVFCNFEKTNESSILMITHKIINSQYLWMGGPKIH